MKKISLLLAAILASVTVSGCDAFTSFFGGDSSQPQDQQKSDDSKKENNGNSDPWEQESDYAVAFNNNEGSGYMAIQTTDGSEFVVPECTFTRTDYHFIKWGLRVNEEWTYYFVGDKITGIKSDIILYAIWEEDSAPSYTVRLYANNGTSEYITATTTGSIFLAPSCTFSKTYYDFDKWALGSESGTKYEIGKTISNISSDIELYATWKEHNYTVTLHANNETGASTTATTNGFSYTLPSCSFKYSGHSFNGWALGSSDGTKYSVNEVLSGIHENIQFYAIWEESDDPFDGYYDSISDTLSGNALLTELNKLNNSKRKSLVKYKGMNTFSAICDADPDGSGKIIGFYDNKKIGPTWDSGSTWNKEHVWPNCRGGNKVENDAHMIRPASTSTNSGRGSKGFGTESFDPGNIVAYYRGVSARIIFYCAIADTSLSLVEDPLNYDGVGSGPANAMGCLSDMLKWNQQYLPTDTSFTGGDDLARRTELNRNDIIQNHEDGQGNRNPFIDHPEYACKIWGNTNSKTKQICGLS